MPRYKLRTKTGKFYTPRPSKRQLKLAAEAQRPVYIPTHPDLFSPTDTPVSDNQPSKDKSK